MLSKDVDICRYTYVDIFDLHTNAEALFASLRSEDAEAYEMQDARGKSTGIFTKYLNRHILQPEKVTHVLEQVSEGMNHQPPPTPPLASYTRYRGYAS